MKTSASSITGDEERKDDGQEITTEALTQAENIEIGDKFSNLDGENQKQNIRDEQGEIDEEQLERDKEMYESKVEEISMEASGASSLPEMNKEEKISVEGPAEASEAAIQAENIEIRDKFSSLEFGRLKQKMRDEEGEINEEQLEMDKEEASEALSLPELNKEEKKFSSYENPTQKISDREEVTSRVPISAENPNDTFSNLKIEIPIQKIGNEEEKMDKEQLERDKTIPSKDKQTKVEKNKKINATSKRKDIIDTSEIHLEFLRLKNSNRNRIFNSNDTRKDKNREVVKMGGQLLIRKTTETKMKKYEYKSEQYPPEKLFGEKGRKKIAEKQDRRLSVSKKDSNKETNKSVTEGKEISKKESETSIEKKDKLTSLEVESLKQKIRDEEGEIDEEQLERVEEKNEAKVEEISKESSEYSTRPDKKFSSFESSKPKICDREKENDEKEAVKDEAQFQATGKAIITEAEAEEKKKPHENIKQENIIDSREIHLEFLRLKNSDRKRIVNSNETKKDENQGVLKGRDQLLIRKPVQSKKKKYESESEKYLPKKLDGEKGTKKIEEKENRKIIKEEIEETPSPSVSTKGFYEETIQDGTEEQEITKKEPETSTEAKSTNKEYKHPSLEVGVANQKRNYEVVKEHKEPVDIDNAVEKEISTKVSEYPILDIEDEKSRIRGEEQKVDSEQFDKFEKNSESDVKGISIRAPETSTEPKSIEIKDTFSNFGVVVVVVDETQKIEDAEKETLEVEVIEDGEEIIVREHAKKGEQPNVPEGKMRHETIKEEDIIERNEIHLEFLKLKYSDRQKVIDTTKVYKDKSRGTSEKGNELIIRKITEANSKTRETKQKQYKPENEENRMIIKDEAKKFPRLSTTVTTTDSHIKMSEERTAGKEKSTKIPESSSQTKFNESEEKKSSPDTNIYTIYIHEEVLTERQVEKDKEKYEKSSRTFSKKRAGASDTQQVEKGEKMIEQKPETSTEPKLFKRKNEISSLGIERDTQKTEDCEEETDRVQVDEDEDLYEEREEGISIESPETSTQPK